MTAIPDVLGPFYDRQGVLIETLEELHRLCVPEYVHVGKSWLEVNGKDIEVLTAWINVAQRPGRVFETALYGEDGLIDIPFIYSTEEQAYAGHWWTVYQLLSGKRLLDGEPLMFFDIVDMTSSATLIGAE